MKQNEITHVVLVLDASGSMMDFRKDCVQVADNLVTHLASNKVEGEEIRITVYDFADDAQCLIYDMDVLRTPSIQNLYKIRGMTALKDATKLAITDLQMTPEKYGEHLFLVYVLTDGMDNRSRTTDSGMKSLIEGLPDHWATSVFIPSEKFRSYVLRCGFPDYNIDVWDASSKAGFEAVGAKIRTTTDAVLTMRRSGGGRSIKSRSLFNLQLKQVTVDDIRRNLTPVRQGLWAMREVLTLQEIRPFCEDQFGQYKKGSGYYQLTKNETIQPNKKLAIMVGGQVYTGPAARQLLGLPEDGSHALVKAERYPDYRIFVESGSVNRKLIPGQMLLYLF